jgi:hypothetical protein
MQGDPGVRVVWRLAFGVSSSEFRVRSSELVGRSAKAESRVSQGDAHLSRVAEVPRVLAKIRETHRSRHRLSN